MASFIGSDQEIMCPICACSYNTPRKLTGCRHSFCERCILTLIQNLKRDEKLGEEFECPVCRVPSKSPETESTSMSEWVQTLDIDKELQTKVGKQNEQDSKWCSQCKYVDKFIKSEVYCSTCQDSFCGKCSEALHSFKILRDHAIIDIKVDGEKETIKKQAVQLLQTFLTCSLHSEKTVEFFCQDDETFCCVNCVTTKHLGCKNIASLKELIEKDDDSEPCENNAAKLVGSLSKLNNHIKSIVNLIKEKDAETKKASEKLALEFQGIKEKVIRLLDAVEEQIAQDSKALTKAISIKSLDEIDLLNAITSEIDVVKYLVGTLIPKLPSDSAMVCCKKAKVTLQGLERQVLERGSRFETEELKLKIEKEFNSIINLGPNETEQIVSVESTAKSFPIPRLNEKFLLREGQVNVVGEKNNCISEISPGDKPRYNSLTFLPDDSLVLTDSYYGICLLVDADSQPADSINFGINEVTDQSHIDENFIHSAYLPNGLIAISILYQHKICFVSSSNGKLEKECEILCKHNPTTIHGLRNGDLCVLWERPSAFGIISICGGSYQEKVYFEKDTNGKMINHIRRMAIDEDRHHVIISYPKGGRKAKQGTIIDAYDFDGNKVFENNLYELKDPRGIALDTDGNIYICDRSLGGIHVLSPKGLFIKMIQEGCPKWPLGIGFSKSMNMFAVTQSNPEYQKVVIFSIGPP